METAQQRRRAAISVSQSSHQRSTLSPLVDEAHLLSPHLISSARRGTTSATGLVEVVELLKGRKWLAMDTTSIHR